MSDSEIGTAMTPIGAVIEDVRMAEREARIKALREAHEACDNQYFDNMSDDYSDGVGNCRDVIAALIEKASQI